ncbi:MAG TPA: twin-arginine translocase subunit TatB [Halieaceae bacterium]|nr:twin-arginine translocase subunit TatB [Halieaceae bacterium]
MFDIGFAELLLIAVVGLLVIGPERLPGAIRTGSAWLNRLRRGFNELKHEVQRELHNDGVMEELRKTSESVRKETERWRDDLTGSGEAATPDKTGDKAKGTAGATARETAQDSTPLRHGEGGDGETTGGQAAEADRPDSARRDDGEQR